MASLQDEKSGGDKVESLSHVHTNLESEEIANLSQEHREYLLQRHGTLELDPVPDASDADPYNFSTSKKIINLALVSFHAFMTTFSAASIQSVFLPMSMDLHVSLKRISYLVALFIAILGGAPLLWRPLSTKYGRRPVFLISLIGSLVGNIGCANSHSYATMGLCRAIVAFFISPAGALGSAVVAETFFKRDRARAMGVWTLLITIGVPVSPFLFGFLAVRIDYRWIFYVLAITNGIHFLLYLFLGPETRYMRSGVVHHGSSIKQKYLTFRRIDPSPLKFWDFVSPLAFITKPCVLLPTIAYSIIFGFASVMLSIEIPQLYPVLFKFNPQEVGLQSIAFIVGSVLGEQIGGLMSDKWMIWRTNKIGHRPQHEFRVWLSYLGHTLAIIGMIVFLVLLGKEKSYSVSPIIGVGIACAGNQIVTTVLVTYAVDCYREQAASVGVFITFVRSMWGFIVPFWCTNAIESLGWNGTAGLVTGMIIAFAILPCILVQWRGSSMRPV